MQIITDNAAMKQAATVFIMDHGSSLPSVTRDAVVAATGEGNWADGHARMLEALYPIRDQLNDAGKTMIGQIAAFLNSWQLLGMAEDARGQRILYAMQRDLGEEAPAGVVWPDPSTDPEYATPHAERVAAAAAEAPVAPPEE